MRPGCWQRGRVHPPHHRWVLVPCSDGVEREQLLGWRPTINPSCKTDRTALPSSDVNKGLARRGGIAKSPSSPCRIPVGDRALPWRVERLHSKPRRQRLRGGAPRQLSRQLLRQPTCTDLELRQYPRRVGIEWGFDLLGAQRDDRQHRKSDVERTEECSGDVVDHLGRAVCGLGKSEHPLEPELLASAAEDSPSWLPRHRPQEGLLGPLHHLTPNPTWCQIRT